jgi:hypothetical protein
MFDLREKKNKLFIVFYKNLLRKKFLYTYKQRLQPHVGHRWFFTLYMRENE